MYAFRLTNGNQALSEDLCQDAVVAFISVRGVRKVKTQSDARFYLNRTIRNKYIDLLRRQGHELSVKAPEEASEAHELTNTLHAAQQLDRLLHALKPADQQVLGMMMAGETLSDIARENGLSYSNAGIRVHRIRKKFKDLMFDM